MYVLRGWEVLVCEGSFGMCKIVPPIATRALICKGHKLASDMFLKNVLRSAMGRPFPSKKSFLRGQRCDFMAPKRLTTTESHFAGSSFFNSRKQNLIFY